MAKSKNSADASKTKLKPFKASKMAKIEQAAKQAINPAEKALTKFKFPGKGGNWRVEVKHLSNGERDVAEVLFSHKKSRRKLALHIVDVDAVLRIYAGTPEVAENVKIEAGRDFLRAVASHGEHNVNMTVSNAGIAIVGNQPEAPVNPEPTFAQEAARAKRKPARKKRAATNSKAYAEQHKDAIIDIHTKLFEKFGADKDFGLAEIKDIIADQYAHPGPVASAIAIGMEYLGLLTRKRDNTSHRVVCRLTGLAVTPKEAAKAQ